MCYKGLVGRSYRCSVSSLSSDWELFAVRFSFDCRGMTSIRKYTPLKQPVRNRVLKGIENDDPLFRKMHEHSTSNWDVFATRAFSWYNYMLPISYGMTEVVVDDKTGEILCVARWELPKMTVMFALRGIMFILYVLSMYFQILSGIHLQHYSKLVTNKGIHSST